MTRAWIIAAACVLAGCSSAGERAEEKYRMVEQANPSRDDLCEAGRKVADGYLEDGDQERFATWKNRAEIDCLSARLGRQLGTS